MGKKVVSAVNKVKSAADKVKFVADKVVFLAKTTPSAWPNTRLVPSRPAARAQGPSTAVDAVATLDPSASASVAVTFDGTTGRRGVVD